jgi:hypothetical protein
MEEQLLHERSRVGAARTGEAVATARVATIAKSFEGGRGMGTSSTGEILGSQVYAFRRPGAISRPRPDHRYCALIAPQVAERAGTTSKQENEVAGSSPKEANPCPIWNGYSIPSLTKLEATGRGNKQ